MLLAVGYYLFKQTISWFRGAQKNINVVEEAKTIAKVENKMDQLEKFNDELEKLAKLLEHVDKHLKEKKLKLIIDGIDDFRFDIDKIRNKKASLAKCYKNSLLIYATSVMKHAVK